MGDVVVGTCSWTDKTMIERWYPRGVSSAEARLRYYAARFDTVEVDSAFYAIPKREYAEAWAHRTPPGFTFHVKAYGMLTGHEVDAAALHPDLRDAGHQFSVTARGRVRDPEPRMVEHAAELFRDAVEPLVEAGKMGGVLVQFPPWFTAEDREHRERTFTAIDHVGGLLGPLPMFIEFRHASWAEPRSLDRALRFLTERNLTFVAVDAPQVAGGTSMPAITGVTGRFGYVRFHGRNRGTWDARTATAADRFDYRYEPSELAEWAAPITEMAGETERTWVMFNNCKYDYAPTNARQMAEILGDVVAPRVGGVVTGEERPTGSEDATMPHEPDAGEQLDLGF
ncbi:MAG: DUF72 domain-containing protein [Coriobacteriia bacterium]|nr:DUF72 domain-containing protein [Coriobacteriia bacterium]